ncbi:ELECTRON CARRIER/IRON ION-BINDING PROTEIN [Salix koriyanagi]|uniref:ELECTRON CARRIER/IRON ION-BINDING PROTEIN n=1 Tax=Salix koriyanagi TaxID=2511006 RepID=A0A9Q0PXL6_9ROSI|nr:ELECTRON CARRIER/IRON ION-BINDING PROTEIN [Salix koriyanagi]
MAASSPVMSNNSSETGQTSISTAAGGTTSFSAPPKTLRGLNKPKCIQCGNVARSRCPYQSCKSCCSRAQNPCHIHGMPIFLV